MKDFKKNIKKYANKKAITENNELTEAKDRIELFEKLGVL